MKRSNGWRRRGYDARIVSGDVATLRAMREVADQANAFRPFDAVIHNVSGGFFYHKQPGRLNPVTKDASLQDQLLDCCEKISGLALP